MPKRVIETVMFKLRDTVRREDFPELAQTLNAYVQNCPGFIARRLSCTEDGTWIEHIEWETMADAKAAAAGISKYADNTEFLNAIDGASARLVHSELKLSVG